MNAKAAERAIIGALIERKRKDAGLNQMTLSLAIGVSLQTIQRYEQGGVDIASRRLSAIAEAVNLDCDEFFSEIALACVERAKS